MAISKLGDIQRGRKGVHRRIYITCPDCGEERWVRSDYKSGLCHKCAMGLVNQQLARGLRGDAPNWKGGERYDDGYVYFYKPEHPRAKSNGYIKRAILILEEKLGRPMQRGMVSHHVNGIRNDDNSANLIELPARQHLSLHNLGRREC